MGPLPPRLSSRASFRPARRSGVVRARRVWGDGLACALALVLGVMAAGAALPGCVLDDYQARGKACDATHACPDGLACVAGVCGECATTADCADGQVCSQGSCVACGSGASCPLGESCGAEGRCEAACDVPLQSLVDGATEGAVVVVPACIYREQVTLPRGMTLAARSGAEVRGSDVWSTWTQSGATFVGPAVPALSPHGACAPGETRCRWPEQVFLDGTALRQVSGTPGPGEFALGTDRALVLGEDPRGRIVEVSVRRRWLTTASAGVTLRGLTMRHAASGTDGALSNDGYSQWTLENARLLDSHGPLVVVKGGSGVVLRRNELERAGQVGIHVTDATGVTVSGNRVLVSNTERFNPEGVAGGIVLHTVGGSRVEENEISGSGARGIACEQDCIDVTLARNRIHGTDSNGLYVGSSERCVVQGNVLWEAGWKIDTVWGWGAGLLVWSASDIEVAENVVAWTPDGITVISQGQSNPRWLVKNVVIRDNVVLSTEDSSETTLWKLSLGWLEDWAGATFAASSGNRGTNNRFWSDRPESNQARRFSWDTDDGFSYLEDFAKTAGGAGSRYLTNEEKARLVEDAGIPPAAEPH